MCTQGAAFAADGPFHPAEGNAQQQECCEIGNHEGAAAVLGGKTGKAQEVAEADSAAGHGQHGSDVGGPEFLFVVLAHGVKMVRASILRAGKLNVKLIWNARNKKKPPLLRGPGDVYGGDA